MLKPHEYPVIGTWYFDLDEQTEFEIVAKDDAAQLLEIQFFSGEVQEMDFEEWFGRRLVAIAAPSDWSGPYEIDQRDEFPNLEDDVIHPEAYQSPPYYSLY